MIDFTLILIDGALVGLVVGAVVLTSFRLKPRIWLNDLPSDIRERAAPMTEQEKRWLKLVGVLVMVTLVGGIALSVMRVSGGNDYLGMLVHAYLVFQVFNLFDFLVLDCGLMLVINPENPPIEGTENAVGYRDFRFHAFKSLKGFILGVPLAGLIAGFVRLLEVSGKW